MNRKQRCVATFLQWGGELWDMISFNLCYLLCCIPIVTVGAATSSLHAVTFSRMEKGDGDVRLFFRTFFRDLGHITPVFFPFLLLGAALVLDFLLFPSAAMSVPGTVFLCSAALFYILVVTQLCMVQARVACTRRQLLLNTFLVALHHPLRTLVMAVLQSLPLLLFFGNLKAFFTLTPIFLCGYFSVASSLSVRLMRRPFQAYAAAQSPERPHP